MQRSSSLPEPLAAKVPEITAIFWVIKIITTGIGESTSDFLGQTFIPLAGIVGVFGFWFALRRQLRAPEYRAPVYWLAVLMVAVSGTMAADALHLVGLSYAITTPLWAIATAAVFHRWYRSEGTLSIHSITTARRERFYWLAVLSTFALGTAAGDLTALTLNMGFLSSAILFAIVIAIPGAAYARGMGHPTLLFWAAYVVTRPLGASIVDWLGKEKSNTGLGIGDGPVSAAGLVAFAALVAYVAATRHGIQPARRGRSRLDPVGAEA